MRYNRFREKKLKMKDIFDVYCKISYDLWEFYDDDTVYEHGDFGGVESFNDPIFIDFDDNEEDYNNYYIKFLETALEKNYFDLFLEFKSCDMCYKAVLSLLKSCKCLKVMQEDNILYVKLPSRPSYEELEDIKDTFDEVCDVIRRHSK